MNNEILEKKNQTLNSLNMDIDQARMLHDKIGITIESNIKNIIQQMDSENLNAIEHSILLEQLDLVKSLEKKEELIYSEYNSELRQQKNKLEEEIEYLEKEEQEEKNYA